MRPVSKITMLSAAEGDCFFLEFLFEDRTFTLLIDGGPPCCWETTLHPFMDRLIAEGKRIDVFLITHLDQDHIGGALRLFESDQYSNLVDGVWFNGFAQIMGSGLREAGEKECRAYRELKASHRRSPDPGGPISVQQCETLVALLEKRRKPINSFVNGLAITGETSSLQLSPHFFIDFLLPEAKALVELRTFFHVSMDQLVPGASPATGPGGADAFEAVMLDEATSETRMEPISATVLDLAHIDEWASRSCGRDPSKTNASSIALCIRFYGQQLLFCGDADGNALAKALTKWQQKAQKELFFDIVKLPHHGAYSNCGKLLDLIDGRIFLLSSDGVRFPHPSPETLAKIVTRPVIERRVLLFNYENEMYHLFHDTKTSLRYGFNAKLATEPLVMEVAEHGSGE